MENICEHNYSVNCIIIQCSVHAKYHFPNLLLWESCFVQLYNYQHQQQYIQLLWQYSSCTQVVLALMITDLHQQSWSLPSQIIVSCNGHGNPKAFLAVAPWELGPMIHPVKERNWRLIWGYQEQQTGLWENRYILMRNSWYWQKGIIPSWVLQLITTETSD